MTAERHIVSRRAVLGAGAAATVVVVAGTGASATEPAQTLSPPAPDPRPRGKPRIDIVCGRCGGDNVQRDAWAIWDTDEQDWVLGAVFDYGHCDDCDGESRLEEVELVDDEGD